MTHPSIKRAREILARGPERAREHEEWRSWHNPEDLIPTASPRVKRKEYTGGERVIYKTNWQGRVFNDAQNVDRESSTPWLNDIAEIIGEELRSMEREFAAKTDLLQTRIETLQAQLELVLLKIKGEK
jgi:hypothetical protein